MLDITAWPDEPLGDAALSPNSPGLRPPCPQAQNFANQNDPGSKESNDSRVTDNNKGQIAISEEQKL